MVRERGPTTAKIGLKGTDSVWCTCNSSASTTRVRFTGTIAVADEGILGVKMHVEEDTEVAAEAQSSSKTEHLKFAALVSGEASPSLFCRKRTNNRENRT